MEIILHFLFLGSFFVIQNNSIEHSAIVTETSGSKNIIKSPHECIFAKDNFCFPEWEKGEKLDLWDDLNLSLSTRYIYLNLGEEIIESQDFNDYLAPSAMSTIWYWDFLDTVCTDNPGCDFDEAAKKYPEKLKEIIQKSLKENIFYRVKAERVVQLSNSSKDIAIVGSWFYEYYGDLYVFDVKSKQFLTTTRTDRLNYIYKTDDFIVIQEGKWGFGDENTELTFFFKNGSTLKIHDPSEGEITLKSVKIDENKNINFVYQCDKDDAESVEKCENQEKEIKITKTFEEIFLLSEK